MAETEEQTASGKQQNYYFSLQYSGIQKTVLRHDRLWSIAGISNILSRMNELEMSDIAKKYGGEAIVAGGGKFTARFPSEADAQKASEECVALLATTLPMLEFQVSEIHHGSSFSELVNEAKLNLLIEELGRQKRQFRGYSVTFNPHLMLCEECGEYPAVEEVIRWRNKKSVVKNFCRVCYAAFEESQGIHSEKEADTSLQKVYHGYFREVEKACGKDPAADFNDLFPKESDGSDTDERKRMAVWFSDLNNMNDKVKVWLRQDEDNVLSTFTQFRDTVVNIIVHALAMTFPDPTGKFLPFRLVVAGGDDLCLVMAEEYILKFCSSLSKECIRIHSALGEEHPLSNKWLEKNGDFSEEKPLKPFGFGGSFVVTSIHTPFSQIHALGEELMSAAKKKTDRQGNSVDWRIMAEDESVTENLLKFERPLFIENSDKGKNGLDALTFNDYLNLRKTYKNISTSHRQQIIGFIIRHRMNGSEVERQMKMLDSSERAKDFSCLLSDPAFRKDGALLPERIATLFELLSIKGGDDE